MKQRPLYAAGGVVLLLAALTVGCASSSAFRFRCEPDINEGLLLTVDLVQVNDSEVPQIRQTGDEWFYSDLRRQLEPRTRTVAVEGGCDTTVKLVPQKGYDTLAIISDFKSGTGSSGNMQFRQKTQWKGKSLQVRVQGSVLTIQEGR
jgi:hypothetical protein